jgi:hypothetical protein
MVTASRVLLASIASAVVLGGGPLAQARDFDHPASDATGQQFAAGNVQRQDTPNDPAYDRAEPDDEDAVDGSTNLYDERYDLFGFPSARTPLALYAEGPNATKPMISGFNAAGAWKLHRGRPDVIVAVLDTGIRWDNAGLRKRIALNPDELPLPRRADGTTSTGYDLDGDGRLSADDYKNDARVDRTAGPDGRADAVDGQDLIRAFSDGTDADGNGYVDDIAGWDFFDDDNDPGDSSSYFAAENHGTGRATEVAEEGDDGQGGIGVCPRCTVMPIRTWDTFVSDGNTFGMGIVYAADNGAAVIEGANGSLYHSAFTEAASQYAYDRGLAQVFSGDDLNTGNHNYPANYDHTMLIQGVATDTQGLGSDFGPEAATFLNALGVPLGSSIPTLTYFRGANTTQFGGHSSIAMEGATGSENTGKAAGAAALVISAARQRGVTLKPDETRAILEQTAEDVLAGNTTGAGAADRAAPGWDVHFGYGRANLGAAVDLAGRGDVPPEASIGDPDWYAPLAGRTATIKGTARARFAENAHLEWQLEWGPGLEPTTWHAVRNGTSDGTVTDFGDLDLDAVRAELASFTPPADPGQPTFSPTAANPYKGQFTVRLTVKGQGIATPGVDRKVLTVLDDDTLRDGFPKRMGTGGEAAPRYADLDGDDREELLLPLEDGTLHAYREDGTELPGWPVHTTLMDQVRAHDGQAPGLGQIPPAREPLRNPVVADLDDDGHVEVVATAGARIYAWSAAGQPRAGFPVEIDRHNCRKDLQARELRHRKCGFIAGPAVGRLEGAHEPLSIVVPGLDQHLYGVRGDGSKLPGFPVELVDPDEEEPMLAESINNPAVGDLDGDGVDDVVVATNEVYGAQQPGADTISGALEQGFADLLGQVTDTSSRVYAVSGKTGALLENWPIKLNGGIQNTLPLIGPGHDAAIATVGGEQVVVVSTTGGALALYRPDGTYVRGMQQSAPGPASDAVTGLNLGALNLFESAVVGDVDGAAGPDVVKYHVTLGQAANLLLVGQNVPYHHLIGAYTAASGAPVAAFPRVTDDYQFLSSSTVAKVDPEGAANQVLAGTGLGLLHAYDGVSGVDAPGFPKVTGGWLYAPAALARDGRLAAVTREGFLFEWGTDAPACQTEWPTFRHDQQGTGNYDKDGTPPGAPRDLTVEELTGGRLRVAFAATGDDGRCGAAARYEVRRGGKVAEIVPEDEPEAGQQVTAEVAPDTARSGGEGGSGAVRGSTSERASGAVRGSDSARTVEVVGVDEAGNRGLPATVRPADPDEPAGAGSAAAGGGQVRAGAAPAPAATVAPSRRTPAAASCTPADGLRTIGAKPRGSGVELQFTRRVSRPVTVEVFQQSIGRTVIGERRVARFTGRARTVRWSGRGRARDGVLFARFTMKLAGGRTDVRRVALKRSGGRFSVLAAFHRPDRCGPVRSFKLTRPVFGGRTGRPLEITFRLASTMRATVTVLRGNRVVRRFPATTRAPGRVHRLRITPRGLAPGAYTVRLEAGGTRQTLTARRL